MIILSEKQYYEWPVSVIGFSKNLYVVQEIKALLNNHVQLNNPVPLWDQHSVTLLQHSHCITSTDITKVKYTWNLNYWSLYSKLHFVYCRTLSRELQNNAAHSNSIHILWTVNMCRLKLNTRLKTIWHTGHLVCPWCKLLWWVRESWRPKLFPQSMQTYLRGSAGAVRFDDSFDQPWLSCTAHLATKGRKILHKYILQRVMFSRN
jgi:hypothetical protein